MKNISKFKVEWSILLPLILFGIISVISIYCTNSLMDAEYQNFYLKQIIWYIVGFTIAYSMMLLGNKFLYNNAWWFYIIGVISLILVLFFGHEANNATCWFKIGPLSIQPSVRELAKRGYSHEYGARELKRTITRELKNPLADFILQNSNEKRISVTLSESQIKITSNQAVFA